MRRFTRKQIDWIQAIVNGVASYFVDTSAETAPGNARLSPIGAAALRRPAEVDAVRG